MGLLVLRLLFFEVLGVEYSCMEVLESSTRWKKMSTLPSCLKGCGGVSVLVNGRELPAIRFSSLL